MCWSTELLHSWLCATDILLHFKPQPQPPIPSSYLSDQPLPFIHLFVLFGRQLKLEGVRGAYGKQSQRFVLASSPQSQVLGCAGAMLPPCLLAAWETNTSLISRGPVSAKATTSWALSDKRGPEKLDRHLMNSGHASQALSSEPSPRWWQPDSQIRAEVVE